ncbi:LuxR C-terminal-related transcriptional regulator [Streptomyces sp. NPDC005479]|uniref:helix-turn-helix transcriptional regulator n=1 Tax=Streptomyces sp. NPDC005479 TaxID=3154879 RepID=UPI0033B06365
MVITGAIIITHSGRAIDTWPLVGRDLELSVFAQSLRDKRGHGFLVRGPAGVGKSRLAEECWERALAEGFRGGRAVATVAAGTVPLGAIAHLIPPGIDLSEPVSGFAAVSKAHGGPGQPQWALLVDDLQWLDATSAMLLKQLMDAGVIRLLATLRSDVPVGDAVAGLIDDDAISRVDLAELTEEQIQDLLQGVLKGTLCPLALHAFHTASGGNVLYLRELLLGALASGALKEGPEAWELKLALKGTPLLTELIGSRLAAVSPMARPVLELLALCGSLSQVDAEQVASPRHVSDLKSAGLVRTRLNHKRLTLSLAHPIYGVVLSSKMTAARKRMLLLEQVERVEAWGIRRSEDALNVVSWRLAATGTADGRPLIQAALLAGHAHDYSTVLDLLEALPKDQRTVETRLLYCATLHEVGRSEEAEKIYAGVDDQAAAEPEIVAVATARAMNLFWGDGHIAEALAIIEAAQPRVGPINRSVLRFSEATLLVPTGAPVKGLALLEDLETAVTQAPHVNTWIPAAMMKTAALAARGRTGEAVAWGQHAYASHQRVSKQATFVPHHTMQANTLIIALTEAGRISEARSLGERSFEEMVTDGAQVPGVWGALTLGRAEWVAGHPAAARRWYAESVTLARAFLHHSAMRMALAGLGAAAALLGDSEAALTALEESHGFPAVESFPGEVSLCEAWLHAKAGRLTRARAVLGDGAAIARESGQVSSEALLLTDIARLGGARHVVDRLNDLARQCDGALAPARAHLAAALAADDPGLLLQATDELHDIGADLLEAEAAAAAAVALRRIGSVQLARAAAHRSAAAAARCPGAWTPALASPKTATALTSREYEIALQAAAGASSKDIATTLEVSVRTIDNHLHRVYSKLGITTRRELARIWVSETTAS